jgi:hypothetical protein
MLPPMAGGMGGVFGAPEMPPFVVIPKKKTRKKMAPAMSGRITPSYEFPAPTSKMPVKTKTTKKQAKGCCRENS